MEFYFIKEKFIIFRTNDKKMKKSSNIKILILILSSNTYPSSRNKKAIKNSKKATKIPKKVLKIIKKLSCKIVKSC